MLDDGDNDDTDKDLTESCQRLGPREDIKKIHLPKFDFQDLT